MLIPRAVIHYQDAEWILFTSDMADPIKGTGLCLNTYYLYAYNKTNSTLTKLHTRSWQQAVTTYMHPNPGEEPKWE